MTEKLLTWQGYDEARLEQTWVEFHPGGLHARGIMLVGGGAPFRADYELDTTADYLTRRLLIRATGLDWSRELRLSRDAAGSWEARRRTQPADGQEGLADVALLDDALDCDLTFSPLTNTMPVLRHRLHREPGEVRLVMAWVLLPELVVVRSAQRYEHIRANADGGGVVRYSSGDFSAELTIDPDGFVQDYPKLGRQV